MKRLSLALTCALAVTSLASAARANIYQWAWVSPTDPTQGKYQSTTLCPGGAGANAAPSAMLNSRNLTQAYLIGANLASAYMEGTTLTNADMNGADLANANFGTAILTNSNLANAIVLGAFLGGTTGSGFTAAQLYSTASYQAGNLTGIDLGDDNLTSWNFTGQNLTNADFGLATLTNANLTNANVQGAAFVGITGIVIGSAQLYSTASYKAGNLTGIALATGNLTSWNFASQNLTNADLDHATLTNANLSGANVTGANLSYATLTGANLTGCNFTGANLLSAVLTNANVSGANFSGPSSLTAAQLYSTASYLAGNLTGIGLANNTLTSWNFAGQNLTNADLASTILAGANITNAILTNANVQGANFAGATGFTAGQLYSTANYQAGDLTGIGLRSIDLTGWNFAGQNLTNADLSSTTLTGANLSNASLTGADVRGATGLDLTGVSSTQNLINLDGSINGLDLSGARTLVVRNYVAGSIPIKVHTGMNMGTNGTIQVVLDGNAWGSTISFDAGIPISLGGTLDVTLAPGVTPASMWGRPVKLFDWTGVTPTGQFTWQDDQTAATGNAVVAGNNSMQPAWEFGGPPAEPNYAYIWDTTHLYDTGVITLFPRGDTNRDGALNSLDVDAIYQHLTVAPAGYMGTWPRPLAAYQAQYDVNGDGVVDQNDVTYELNHYFLTSYGDANLDRGTDFGDFQTLLNHWQNSGPGVGLAQADFNGDGVVDFMDFQIILLYWNPGGWNFAPAEQAPEPASLGLILLGGLAVLCRKKP
jgi:uncharacterized protein YjbI with pentapeptide repeats